jgi:hypothetical protein
MSGKIPRPFGSIALVATLLISGMRVGVPASADDCLAAPNFPAPQGSHWYYRLDWATQRKCWYVRALGPSGQQAAGPAALARVTRSQSMPATSEPTPAAETPAPRTNTSSPTSAEAAGQAPSGSVAWPDAPSTVTLVTAKEPIAVPTDAPADAVSVDAERTARGDKPTKNAGMPMIIFPILALGLTVVGFLFVKIAATRRTRTTNYHAEPGWIDDQGQHQWRDDRQGSVDERREYQSLISVVSDLFRVEGGADQITYEISKRRDKLAQLHQDLDRLLQSTTPA